MKILVAGKYNPEYNRTKILLDGLKQLEGVEVIEMPFSKKKEFNLHDFQKHEADCDFIYSPPFSHKFVRFLKKKTNKPFIFDPLISNYLTKVFDYKNVSRWSPRAYKNFLKDKLPFQAADLLISDTQEHKEYFHNTFGIPLNKIKVLPIGANTKDFTPEPIQNKDVFKVGFYGGFIPLQGVKNIIETAELLVKEKDIHFHLIGTGFQYQEMQDLVALKKLSNITFEGWVDYNQLSDHLNTYEVCLGIFGETPKAKLVIPNKIYHYAAMGKAIITMDSKAIKEVFTDQKNIILTSQSAIEISKAILHLKNNSQQRKSIEQSALQLLQEDLNEVKIAEKFLEIVSSTLSKKQF